MKIMVWRDGAPIALPGINPQERFGIDLPDYRRKPSGTSVN
jgi:hypothetical protein